MTEIKGTGNTRRNFLLPVLAAVCALALAAMAYVLAVSGGEGREQGTFTPPPFDQSALPGTPAAMQDASGENGQETAGGPDHRETAARLEKLGYSSLDAVNYQVSVCGAPVLEDGKAILYLTNPETNQVWLKVRILDASGQILGESGLLRPGEYVESTELDMEAVKAAMEALDPSEKGTGLPVTLRLMAYEPETYHSAGAVSLSTVLTVSGGW